MKRSVLLALFSAVVQASAALVVQNLQVEYGPTPLGIDVAQPRFSWQMAATAGERDQAQSAYQIQVREPGGKVVWTPAGSKARFRSASGTREVRSRPLPGTPGP